MRLGGDCKRGDGFQAGLDALLLSAVSHRRSRVLLVVTTVLASRLQALAAPRALRRGRAGVSGGGRRGAQHLEPPDGDDGEQRANLLLGVEWEVAENVLVRRTSGRHRGQAAPLILKQHRARVSSASNTSQVHIFHNHESVQRTKGSAASSSSVPERLQPNINDLTVLGRTPFTRTC